MAERRQVSEGGELPKLPELPRPGDAGHVMPRSAGRPQARKNSTRTNQTEPSHPNPPILPRKPSPHHPPTTPPPTREEFRRPAKMFYLARSSGVRSASAVSRMARGVTASQTRMFVAPTVARRADFVQELYLKELKAYKTPALKPTDAEGHVQTFSAPKTPASPEEADLASSLKEYEGMAVDVEGAEAPAAGAGGQQAAARDWLEEEEEA